MARKSSYKGVHYFPSKEEFELFYSENSREDDCVGHLRGYFDGDSFRHQWFDHVNSSSLNTDAFKSEFYPLMDGLIKAELASRKNAGILWRLATPLDDMLEYRGDKVMTEHYEYYIRIPSPEYIRGNYTYIYCYKRKDV